MNFTTIIKEIFSRKKKKYVDNSNESRIKRFLSKISGSFMLPISIMAIAGLFLGIGAAIASHSAEGSSAKTFGLFVQNLGGPIFSGMPLLFLISIIISFTDDIGTAVFAGVASFLVFLSLQSPFITVNSDDREATILYGGLSSSIKSKLFALQTSVLGITTLNTSIFGGIIVGLIMSWAYKRFHVVELPNIISFFGGKRFVAFVGIILMIPLAFAFLLIWPWIGIGLAYFGEQSGKVAGLDSFIFGFVERALIPFGLHHVFYAPLWYSSAGGDFSQSIEKFKTAGGVITMLGDKAGNIEDLISKMGDKTQGDSFIWIQVSGLDFNEITYTMSGGESKTLPVFDFFSKELGIKLGRFMQGKFSFMQMGLPAAGAAMIMAAPKQNRKEAIAIIVPAALTSFLTGITEPIEFTFVFLAPILFWGFHCLMAATSFFLMNIFGAHVGMTFSGGFIDAVIYGMIPMAKGTEWYWIYVIGLVFAPIYYFVFLFYIKKFNVPTPGRVKNSKLFTKSDYKKAKSSKISTLKNEEIKSIVRALGGKTNIVKTSNCATRLRYDLKDTSKINEDQLKKYGIVAVMKISKKHAQIIVGPKASTLNSKIEKYLK